MAQVENIVIIGASRLAWFFIKLIEEFAANESQIVAVLDERPQFQYRSLNGHLIAGSPVNISKIFDEYLTHGIEIHKIVVANPFEDFSQLAQAEIERISEKRSIAVQILSEHLLLSRSARPTATPADAVVMHAECSDRPIWKIKRLLDILLAVVTLIAVAPVAAVVAILVLIDVGPPIVFWQQRLGRLGRPLHVYKFRTMRAPFDRKGRQIPDSVRLSSIGRLLRAARLDEIPQLWNILSGSMSAVGPRPLLAVDQPKTLSLRLRATPGLTGLAQISGGKLISIEEKDALDEQYVRHASPFLDLNILVRTIWVMFRGDSRNEEIIAAALAEKRARLEAKENVALAPHAPSEKHKTEGVIRITKGRPTEQLALPRRRRETA
jgi:lipopolysaccharide/colanic/teichoic acid biosynthesis glycosyltransferase